MFSSQSLDLGGNPYITMRKGIIVKVFLLSLGWEDHFRNPFAQPCLPLEHASTGGT